MGLGIGIKAGSGLGLGLGGLGLALGLASPNLRAVAPEVVRERVQLAAVGVAGLA